MSKGTKPEIGWRYTCKYKGRHDDSRPLVILENIEPERRSIVQHDGSDKNRRRSIRWDVLADSYIRVVVEPNAAEPTPAATPAPTTPPAFATIETVREMIATAIAVHDHTRHSNGKSTTTTPLFDRLETR